MSNKTGGARLQKTVRLAVLAMLTGLILVMTFTPIGYLRIPGVLELTLIMVPVVIGAVTQGPAAGAFLGAVFGFSSFAQCFMGSPLGAVLIAHSVARTLVVCVLPRILAGWLCGLVFKVCSRRFKRDGGAYVLASACGSALNTVFFLGFLAFFFWSTRFTPEQAAAVGAESVLKLAIAAALAVNAPVELAVCTILGSAAGKGVSAVLRGQRALSA